MKKYSPAANLSVAFRLADGQPSFPYSIDKIWQGEISIRFPFELSDPEILAAQHIAPGIALFLGQLCLAQTITLDFEASPVAADRLAPLARYLYGIRSWKDHLPAIDHPLIVADRIDPRRPLEVKPDASSSALLWSGGKDSTLSSELLRRNEITPVGVHTSVNFGVEMLERKAVVSLAHHLNIELVHVMWDFPQFIDISNAFADEWNQFPHYNHVPFGRDLITSLIGIVVAVRRHAKFVSLGHDHDCRTAQVSYLGATIPRNDVESVEGATALQAFIRDTIASDIYLLPPVARFTEMRILREMLVGRPDLMSETSFCFWGDNCGRCAKCLRYYLAARVFEREHVLYFQTNPLKEGTCPELMDLLRSNDTSGLFHDQIAYYMARLIERGDIRTDDDILRAFSSTMYERYESHLDDWEADLMRQYDDPQVPAWFHTE